MTHAMPGDLLLLMKSYVVPQAIYVLVKLGVVEALAGGAALAGTLAEGVGADEAQLVRLLRLGVQTGVLAEPLAGRFALGPLGHCLLREAPGSMRAWVLAMGEQSYPAAAGILDTVRSGEELCPAQPEPWQEVERSLVHHAWAAARERYDLEEMGEIVVFSGRSPGRPVPEAQLYLVSEPLASEEDDLRGILREIRPVIPPLARLVLAQRLITRGPYAGSARVDDLVRLTVSRGRERTEAEYAALLGETGFELRCVVPTSSGLHLLEAVAA